MNHITVVAESVSCADDLKVRLAQYFEAECLCLNDLPESPPGKFTFVDVDLRDSVKIFILKHWLARRPTNGRVISALIKGRTLNPFRHMPLAPLACCPYRSTAEASR